MSITGTNHAGHRRRGARVRELRGRGIALARLVSWCTSYRTDPASLELTVAGQQWLHAYAAISVIDGAALVEIDTSALDPARRCRVYVNGGPVFDARPDSGDHDVEHLADYLAELRAQELANLTRAGAATRMKTRDLPEWPHQEVSAADIGRDWPLVTLDQVVRWGGTTLTENELDRLVAAIPQSSIPDAINAIVGEIVATSADTAQA
ncbi:hypothetical protein AB0I35_13005 [Nocardia sp. NPDC050378]|uniref:hypothetical protein n=1 Tax=Nocardia sp. NPDC050378 TaxID=3155400 RepID=UPI0033C2B819